MSVVLTAVVLASVVGVEVIASVALPVALASVVVGTPVVLEGEVDVVPSAVVAVVVEAAVEVPPLSPQAATMRNALNRPR